MIWVGKIDLSLLWKDINHFYPIPCYIAPLSSQSMSTPSRLFSNTKVPSFTAQSIGSIFDVVGNSVAPNALINILIPALLYFYFNVFWIYYFVLPKTLSDPKYFTGSDHIHTMSNGPEVYVQNANTKYLYKVSFAYPGTPMPAAIFSGGHQLFIRLIYASLIGY